MARCRQSNSTERGGISYSDSGKHKCYECDVSNEGFCSPMNKFSVYVTVGQCERIRNGEPPVFNISHITDDLFVHLMYKYKMSDEELIKKLNMSFVNLKIMRLGVENMSDASKNKFVERMNKYL